MQGIAMVNLGSTQAGVILLWGLFVYDVFWVFFTPVMVTVATKIEGPIKLLFPSTETPGKFNMLGLGDIVLPGLSLSPPAASFFTGSALCWCIVYGFAAWGLPLCLCRLPLVER